MDVMFVVLFAAGLVGIIGGLVTAHGWEFNLWHVLGYWATFMACAYSHQWITAIGFFLLYTAALWGWSGCFRKAVPSLMWLGFGALILGSVVTVPHLPR